MLEWLSTSPMTRLRVDRSWLKEYLCDYLDHRRAQQYPLATIRTYANHILRFSEFVDRRDIHDVGRLPHELNEFIGQLPTGTASQSRTRSAINCFLSHLKTMGAIPTNEPPRVEHSWRFIENYCKLLADLRGLGPETIRHIRATCRLLMTFLTQEESSNLGDLRAESIHRFLIDQAATCGRRTLQGRCSSIRGFLVYLHRTGVVCSNLSRAVVAPRVYRDENRPRFLTRPQVEAVLAVIGRDTAVGRRDYAMITLMAVYGLRSCEAIRLRLDDIDWRNETLRIARRKAGNETRYPLSLDVGAAIIDYLRNSRPKSSHREVFLAVIAPFQPLCHSAGLSLHLSGYLARAGISEDRSGTHIFRYSCAQRLFMEGTPLKHIGDYLGHGHADSTQHYLKIALDDLREVAESFGEDLL